MDPAQLVAQPVVAHGDVLCTAAGERTGPVLAGAGPAAAHRDRRQLDDTWRDDEAGGRGERASQPHEPERVRQPDSDRPELIATAPVGVQLYSFRDAFNPLANWYDPDVLGLDLGISMLMAENHRAGFVWEQFMKNPEAQKAMRLAGFR